MLRTLTVVCGLLALLGGPATAAAGSKWTMLVDLDGRQIEGAPLAWSRDRVFLLGRDGRLWDFAPNQTEKFRKTSSSFSSYSAAEIRAGLERELGGRLQVTGTGHYLVAHPRGKEAWAQRFEDLYRSCIHYFRIRGLELHEPEFPLVAVVWGSRQDFVRFANSQGTQVRPDVLGFYSPSSNRVMLYDQGPAAARSWQQNDSTIIHEATHQVAFNVGLHNRFAKTPTWMAEGLGTLFEAPGVWNWREYPQLSDRINRGRLTQFRQWQTHGRKSGAFAQLLGSDRQFEVNPPAAYAEAWAWALFLTELYPRQFAQYVHKVATRPNFTNYPAAQRVADFTAVFGDDLRMLEKHFLDFIATLK